MTLAATPESMWEAWSPLDDLPRLEVPAGRVVVVSAHPDDEVLGAGGLLAAMALRSGPPPRFFTVTDGEASHPRQSEGQSRALRETRAQELFDGLQALGHPSPHITRWELPDSGVADHADLLATRLAGAVRDADLVLCPSQYDGHVDHATVGRVVADVCASLVEVWQFPIWVWHWTEPDEGTAPWGQASRVDLTDALRRRKELALACFTSQIAPLPDDPSGTVILAPGMLAHFTRPFEVFFR